MEPTPGLEPGTARLQVECATNCATPAACRDDRTPDRPRPTLAHARPYRSWRDVVAITATNRQDREGGTNGRLAPADLAVYPVEQSPQAVVPGCDFHSDRPARSCR